MTTNFTAHGLELETAPYFASGRWIWLHGENGILQHSSVEMYGTMSGVFDTEADAKADAEAYAAQVMREMAEAQSRPYPKVAPTADMIELLMADRPKHNAGEYRFSVHTDNECNSFDFTISNDSHLAPGKWFWVEENEETQSRTFFDTAFEAQKDAIRHASEWEPEHIREYRDRLDMADFIRNDCYN